MSIALGLIDSLAIACAIGVATSLGVLLLRWRSPGNKDPQSTDGSPNRSQALCIDFDPDGAFVLANEPADRFLHDIDLEAADWGRLRAELLPRFPGLPARITATDKASLKKYDAISPADPAQLTIETHPGGLTVQLYPEHSCELSLASDAHRVFAQLGDLEPMRAACEDAPYPIWQTLPSGRIGWANRAFWRLDTDVPRNELDKNAPLFQLPDKRVHGVPDRVSVRDSENNRTYWYDVSSQPCGESALNFAYDIKDVIKAESAQRNFIQTLAKTFAQLSTGLAVFDRQRQLVMFNPALLDLTRLSPEFLTMRPTLFALFDELRNKQVMPEPKDYGNWRERIADVITAASDGTFSETWSLPTGQTFRVNGKPHPDGAIAFLFEDISAEIALTRRFRGEMEVTQSALNALEDGIAIFSPTGQMVQCNQAMMLEWNIPQATDDAVLSITDLTRIWQKKCQPSPIWGDMRDCVASGPERASWTAEVALKTGNLVDVQVSPIASGSSLVTDTAAWAARIGAVLSPGDTLLLHGPVGAGKSYLARALIQSLQDVPEDVPSPTFTLVQTYETARGEIWHADLYRLSGPDDIIELGLDEAMTSAICLIEWPDRLGDLTPETALNLTFRAGSTENERMLDIPSALMRRLDKAQV